MRSLVLAFTLVLATAAFAAGKRVEVPEVPKSPKIDGTVAASEWAKAVRVRLGDNGFAYLQHNNQYLFVAIAARRAGTASLCSTTKANAVRVLHASAALGTAQWQQKDAKWSLERGFDFQLRDTGDTAEAQAARRKFLGEEGWFANASPTGLTTREYQIRLDGRREIPLAIGFMSFVSRGKFEYDYWPETMLDGCAELDLAAGVTEYEYTFDPKTWGVAALQ